MDAKHLVTLEFPKVLARLAAHTSFSAGEERARALTPATDPRVIRGLLETTIEARALLDAKPSTTIGGARDVRPLVVAALRGTILPPGDLLDVRDTLVAARNLHRTLTRLGAQFPHLAVIAGHIQPCSELNDEISRCLDERANLRDTASPELARIRRDVRIAHDRLREKLQNIIQASRNQPFLQEAVITQREGRYVIPLKADFKGRIRGVVHDVSASGATIFIEPLSVVELNNTWRERQLEEKREVERILAALSDKVAQHAADIEQSVETLAELDLAFAKARYAEALDGVAPALLGVRAGTSSPAGSARQPVGASTPHDGAVIRFFKARHPLLDPKQVVPIDLVLDGDTRVLIITGPNTGGKTVSLKTAGLLTLMAQAGLHIPAGPGSALAPFKTVYADIGDEQSIEQSLSTFSSHLTNIISFLDEAGAHSLVLLDELGAGTDPAEGSALAHSLLEHFRERGAVTLVATHYPKLKTYAQLTPGVRNASVEFDPETLSPTYKLIIGLPGRSNAFAIARRLGLPRGIAEKARKMVTKADLRTEDMLADLHRLRIQEAQARDTAHAARAEAERVKRELRARLDSIDQERQDILEEAREEARTELESVRTEMRTLRRRLQSAAKPLGVVTTAEKTAAELESVLSESAAGHPLASSLAVREEQHAILSGDAVWVPQLNAEGRVMNISGGQAEVQVGPARTRVSLSTLVHRGRPSSPGVEGKPIDALLQAGATPSPGNQVDLRGCVVEEALARLDRHLDPAWRAGLPWVRIIHGKGTGALRKAVRGYLADHPLVGTYEGGGNQGGGEGVTIAKLVQV